MSIKTDEEDGKDETEEIKARILAVNKVYSSMQIIYRSQKIQRYNKIILYKALFKPALRCGSVTRTLIQMTEKVLCSFERNYYKEFMVQCRIKDADILDEIYNYKKI